MNRSSGVINSKVSVVISTFNRENYITQAIDSVLNQTYKDYEIIVVDDGSTDNTEEVLEPYMDKIKYFHKKNSGCANARNCGIRNSVGEYLTFLDSDDLFEPKKLEIQVPILEHSPNIGFVYSDGFLYREGSKTGLKLNPAIKEDNQEFAEKFFLNPRVYMSSTLIRRRCFEDVGLFHETLKNHEDSDLLLRIALLWQVRFSNYPSVTVRYHSSNKSSDRIGIYKSIIESSLEILKSYPSFKNILGVNADRRIAELRYLLACEYLKNKSFKQAKNEFISLSLPGKVNFRVYLYILILSSGKTTAAIILKLIQFCKKIISKTNGIFKQKKAKI